MCFPIARSSHLVTLQAPPDPPDSYPGPREAHMLAAFDSGANGDPALHFAAGDAVLPQRPAGPLREAMGVQFKTRKEARKENQIGPGAVGIVCCDFGLSVNQSCTLSSSSSNSHSGLPLKWPVNRSGSGGRCWSGRSTPPGGHRHRRAR